MNHILNRGVPWAIGLLMGLAAAAQTPPDTNATSGQVESQPQLLQSNVATNPNPLVWAMPTNQFGTGNGSNNLFGVIPSVPPMFGPGTVGSAQLSSPLMGTSVFGAARGAAGGFGSGGFGSGGFVPTSPGIPIWGPISLHPNLTYSFGYATGIESQPGHETKTIVQTVSVGSPFGFDLGSHWQLSYTPAFSIYSDPAFHDSLSIEALSLTGTTTYHDWAYSFSQSYASSDDPLVETGTQTSQQAYGTSFGAGHQLNSRLSIQFGLSQDIRDASGFNNIEAWTASSGLSYRLLPQLGVGLSMSGGYTEVSTGSSLVNESISGSINFSPGQKLALSLSVGGEDTQFVDPSAPPFITPIFSGMLRYKISPDTSLSIGASRSVSPSYFANQIEVATSVGVSLAQRLSQKLSLSLNAGYSTEPLTAIVAGQPLPQYFLGAPPRTAFAEDEQDSSTSFGVSLSYAVIKRVGISAYYSLGENSSSQSNFKYTSSQIGFSVSYSY